MKENGYKIEFDVKKFTLDHFVEWILDIYLPCWKIDVYSRMDSDFHWILSFLQIFMFDSCLCLFRRHKGYRVIQIMVKLLKWRFAREKAFKILDNWKEDAFVDKLNKFVVEELRVLSLKGTIYDSILWLVSALLGLIWFRNSKCRYC